MTTAEPLSKVTPRPHSASPHPPSLLRAPQASEDPPASTRRLLLLHCVHADPSALIHPAHSSSPFDAPLEPPDPVSLQARVIIPLLQAHREVFKSLLHSPHGTLIICSHVDLLNLDCGFLEVRGHILFISVSPKPYLQEALQDLW